MVLIIMGLRAVVYVSCQELAVLHLKFAFFEDLTRLGSSFLCYVPMRLALIPMFMKWEGPKDFVVHVA